MALFGKNKSTEQAEDIVIDLEPARQVWGGPGHCPECKGRGYLDRIDIRDRVMFQHCLECGHNWSVTETELADA
jgi:Zn ribbon nucleic-acid-binding protein